MTSFLQVVQLCIKKVKHKVDMVKVKGEDFQVRDAEEVKVEGTGKMAMILAVVEVPVVIFLLFLVLVFFLGIFLGFVGLDWLVEKLRVKSMVRSG